MVIESELIASGRKKKISKQILDRVLARHATVRHVSNFPRKKRKRENLTRKKEEKILFLYFCTCTQKVKKKRGKSKPKRGNQPKRGSLTCLYWYCMPG